MMFKRLAEGFRLKGNIYVALALSLLLMMSIYMLCRVSFYFYNAEFFPDMTFSRFGKIMLGGLRFDLSALLYLNSLFFLLLIIPFDFRFRKGYQKVLKYLFLIVNSIGLAMNISDTLYYQYTLRRTTLSVLRQFENEQNIGSLIFQFLLDYWYALIFWAVLVFIMTKLFGLIRIDGPQVKNRTAYYFSGVVAMLLIVGLVIAGMRGGFGESTRPITLSNAAQYATHPKDINLVLNTPFAILRTAKTPVIQRVNYYSQEEADQLFPTLHVREDSSSFQPKNVVVIILESFSKEFFGIYNRDLNNGTYKGYTPFLDSLIGQSQAYQYSFANGRKSIDAMPSVICSIPSIEVPYVLSHYSGNKINSLPGLLKEKGYYTSFFHGAPNGSMGFQAFANLCGFDDYFGKDEYNNNDDYDGIWGIWDHKFLQFYADKMNTFKEPFYTNFFSVSSHHPYNLPDEFKGTFKEGDMSIYKLIEYTDYSLKKFFQKASKMPWYKNTVFVISADHASAQIKVPEYNTAWGYFSIPIFFFQPSGNDHSFKQEIIQQVDIMPTVLGMLHYDKSYIAFGRDIFHDKTKPFAFNYLDNTYQAFRGNYLLQFDGTKTMSLYDFRNDKFLKENLLSKLPDTVRVMEGQLKAFIQQYNNRMVDDNLTIEGPQSPGIKKME
ncbi:MAG: sulfatase-like hydrolase/transferase [Cyclobacteriaceae bacterium]|nr:sulfatase-like hydrolase/transferase [Cyclobacteriaceae bacterium]